jgi:phage terminase large subunit-like protein
MMKHSLGRKTSLTLAPRGFGKSTILTIAFCVFKILQNPNIRILISSKTDKQAEKFLREVKAFLRLPSVVEIFGEQVGEKWDTREIIVRGRTRIAKEPTVSTVGVAGSVVGGHYDIVIKDDLVEEQNSRTETQRKQLLTWYQKVLEPCIEPWGIDATIGTRYHPDDLYGHLIRTQFRKAKKGGYLRLSPFTKEGESIWPERYSVEYLKRKKARIGITNFMSQYHNDTSYMEGDFFSADDFLYYDFPPPNLKVFQGVDLAIKRTDKASRFATVTIGVDMSSRDIYVLHYNTARLSFLQQMDRIIEEYNRYDPILCGIEANGFQFVMSDTLKSHSDLRVVPIPTLKDKESRAYKFAAVTEGGHLFVKRSMHRLIADMISFPNKTDLFDALDLAYQTSRKRRRRKRREDEPGLI